MVKSKMPWRRKVIVALALAVAAWAGYVGLRYWHDWAIERRINRYSDSIGRQCQATGLPVEFVRAVIRVESGGDPAAVSRIGAKGLMQLMPDAERDALARLRIAAPNVNASGSGPGLPSPSPAPGDLFDPDYNIRIGTAYLRQLADRFDGDAYLTLAAYHMGPTRVARLCESNPGLTGREIVDRFAPAVTQKYCRDILSGCPRYPRLPSPLRLNVVRPPRARRESPTSRPNSRGSQSRPVAIEGPNGGPT